MAVYDLQIPLSNEDVNELKLGDLIYVSGSIFTCRSRLHKYIFDEKNVLPFATVDRNVLVHAGPVIIKENDMWKLVAFTPTSSLRFEKWGALAVRDWGLKVIIGKTTMGRETAREMEQCCCVHACPLSVSSNLWLDAIEIEDVYLFDELGSIEAAWQMKVNRLGPFLIDIDCRGKNYFDEMDLKIKENMGAAYMLFNY